MTTLLSVLLIYLLFFIVIKVNKALMNNTLLNFDNQVKENHESDDELDYEIRPNRLEFSPDLPTLFIPASSEVPFLKIIDGKLYFYATINSGISSEYKVGDRVISGKPIGEQYYVIATGADFHWFIRQHIYTPVSGKIDFIKNDAMLGDLMLILSPDKLPCKKVIRVYPPETMNIKSWGINEGDEISVGQWIGIKTAYHDDYYYSPYSGKVLRLAMLGNVEKKYPVITIECDVEKSTQWYIGTPPVFYVQSIKTYNRKSGT